MSWLTSPGAVSYNLKRSVVSGAETNLIATTGTNYLDSTVANGTTYYYVVSAVFSGGRYAESIAAIRANALAGARARRS